MTDTKPCFVCHARLPFIGPTRCDKHGGLEQRDNDKRFHIVKEAVSQPDIGLYFEITGDPERDVPDTTISSFRTNLTECWCSRHWLAYEARSPWCPLCRLAEMRKSPAEQARRMREKVAELPAIGDDEPHHDAMNATDAELERRGWSRDVDAAIERWRPKKAKGKAMGKKNDEKPDDQTNGKQVKTQRITMTLPVELRPEELATRADRQSHLIAERDAIVDEAKAANKHAKARIEEKDAEIRKTATEIRDRRTYQPVECEERFVYRTGVVEIVRIDTKEKIRERAMSASERQTELPGVEAGKPNGNGAQAAEPKKKRGRKPKSEQQEASPAE